MGYSSVTPLPKVLQKTNKNNNNKKPGRTSPNTESAYLAFEFIRHSSGHIPLWFCRFCFLALSGPKGDDQSKGRGCGDSRGKASNASEMVVALRRDHLLEHTCGNNGKFHLPKYWKPGNLLK